LVADAARAAAAGNVQLWWAEKTPISTMQTSVGSLLLTLQPKQRLWQLSGLCSRGGLHRLMVPRVTPSSPTKKKKKNG
jgi:hypothetical protein